jgi:hypothetical protein
MLHENVVVGDFKITNSTRVYWLEFPEKFKLAESLERHGPDFRPLVI